MYWFLRGLSTVPTVRHFPSGSLYFNHRPERPLRTQARDSNPGVSTSARGTREEGRRRRKGGAGAGAGGGRRGLRRRRRRRRGDGGPPRSERKVERAGEREAGQERRGEWGGERGRGSGRRGVGWAGGREGAGGPRASRLWSPRELHRGTVRSGGGGRRGYGRLSPRRLR